MKKIIIFLVVLLIFSLASCKNTKLDTLQNSMSTSSNNPLSNHQINGEDKKADYVINENVIEDKTDEHNIWIKYPQLSGSNSNLNEINQTIKNYAKDYIYNNYSVYAPPAGFISIEIEYEITLSSCDLFSVVFYGYGNAKKAAHPNNEFFTLNINLQDAKQILISDLYQVDDNFITACLELWKSPKALKKIERVELPEEKVLYLADENLKSNTFSIYLTDDSLGITFNVSHAIGDHMEIEIPYQGISEFLK